MVVVSLATSSTYVSRMTPRYKYVFFTKITYRICMGFDKQGVFEIRLEIRYLDTVYLLKNTQFGLWGAGQWQVDGTLITAWLGTNSQILISTIVSRSLEDRIRSSI